MKYIAMILMLAALAGCGDNIRYTKENALEANTLRTYKHDGHLWVVYRSGYRGGLTHHPDCPCSTARNKTDQSK